jgi:hypothetical protein
MVGSRTRRLAVLFGLVLAAAATLPGGGGSALRAGPSAAEPSLAVKLKGVSAARTTKGHRLTLRRPARVARGDVLVAGVNVRARGMRPPPGWRLIRVDWSKGSSAKLTQAVYYKVAGAVEPPVYRWRFAVSRAASGGLLAYGGLDAVRPVLAHSGRITRNSRWIRAPSVTASVPNVLVVGFFALSGRGAVSTPPGMAKRFGVTGKGFAGTSSAAADVVLPDATETGVKAARLRVPHSSVIGQLVALRPDATTAPPLPPPGYGVELPPSLPPSTGQTFYVATTGSDSNPGTFAQPWRTIQHALDVLQAGQRALARGGTYAESLDIARAGTASAPITIENYPGERPIVNGGGQRPLEIGSTGAYLRVRGFVFENSPYNSGGNIDLYGHHLDISGNEVRNAQDQGIYSAEESHHVQILGNWIHHNGQGVFHQSHGIYLQGDDHLVANNVIHDHPEGFGIQVYDRNRRSILVQNTVTGAGHSGIVVGGSGGVDNIRVINNIFAFNAHYGISHDSTCPTASRADHNVVYGNAWGDLQTGCSGFDFSRGNRTSDPLFANYAGRNLHVNAGSPAIDYALPEYSPATDFDGVGRPQVAGADSGAYERP